MNYAEAMIYLWHAMENIAIAASCTITAIHFEKPGMLRFLAIIPINSINITHKGRDNADNGDPG